MAADQIDRLRDEIRVAVTIAANLLARGEYDTLASITRNRMLTAELMEEAVTTYGRELVDFPSEGWDLVDIYGGARSPATFAVDVPLWTREEGRSDLTLQLQLTEDETGTLATVVTSILVQ